MKATVQLLFALMFSIWVYADTPPPGTVKAKITDGTNIAAVKPATTAPTVTDPSLVVAISPNSPISVTSVPPVNAVVTGTITSACASGSGCSAGSYVQITSNGAATLGYETHGTWVASITTDVSFDPACTASPSSVLWFQSASVDTDTNESFYITTWSNSKNNDPWVMNIAGSQCARVRATSYTSGTVSITLNSGVGTSTVWAVNVGNVGAGSTDVGNPIKVGGVYHSSAPSLADGQRGDIQLDSLSRLVIRALASGTDSVSSVQSGAWNTGRTWSLLNTTDSVNVGNFPATFGVTQSTSPWVVSGTITATNSANGNTGAAVPAQATQVGGSDGVNLRALKVSSTGVVAVDNSANTQPVSGTVMANIGTTNGLALDASVTGLQVNQGSTTSGQKGSLVQGAITTAAPTYTTAQTSPLSLNTSGGLRVDGSGVTQPVSAASLPLPTGASTSANQATGNSSLASIDGKLNSLGQKTMANSVPVTIASDQSTVAIITASLPLPTGAATSANQTTAISNQTNGTQKTQVVDGAGAVQGPVTTLSGVNYMPVTLASSATNGSAVPARSNMISGSDGANARTLSTDTSGRLNTNTMDGTGTAITSSTFNSKTGLSAIASGQDILTVTGVASALNGDAIVATDVAAYRDIALQIVVTGTNTTTFQGSNDNFINTFSVNCQTVAAANAAAVQTTAATILVHCPVKYRYFRARITAFTSGTSTGTAEMSPLASSNDLGQRSVAVNGTVTVTGTVNTNPATASFSTQVASAARVASGNSGNITQAAPNTSAIFEVNVTAASGTTPTLDVVFQESYDNGTTWTDEYHWERITATGQFSSPFLAISTSHFRFVWTITGTTPSFTFSVGSTQGNHFGYLVRRFFDRTIVLNTASSTSASFDVGGCRSHNFTVNQSACTTFPTIAEQFSDDNVNFATSGITTATTGNGTFISSANNTTSKYARLIVTTVGTTCVLGYITLNCEGN